MSVLVVPTFSDQSYVQQTTFEGTRYNLQFDYNQRGACWYMSIADVNNVDILNGVKLITGFPLLHPCKDPRRPPGQMIVVSSTSDGTPPGLVDLLPGSGRCALYYVTSDWVAAIVAGNSASLITQLQSGGATSSPLSTYGLV